MSDRFKFRIYSFLEKSFYYFSIGDGEDGYPQGIASGVSEVQQYTGYKDFDNVEIYEGDILKNLTPHKYSPDIFVVKWSEFEPSDDMGVGGVGFVLPWFHCSFRPKIISNIFENPELLS